MYKFSGEGILCAGFIIIIIGCLCLCLFVFFILPVCLSACLPVDMITAIGCKEVGCSAKYLVTLQVTNNMIWVNNHLTVGCVSF